LGRGPRALPIMSEPVRHGTGRAVAVEETNNVQRDPWFLTARQWVRCLCHNKQEAEVCTLATPSTVQLLTIDFVVPLPQIFNMDVMSGNEKKAGWKHCL
jgi:hypothetical protein